MTRRLARLDRLLGRLNVILLVLAIGLGCLDLGILLALHAPTDGTTALGNTAVSGAEVELIKFYDGGARSNQRSAVSIRGADDGTGADRRRASRGQPESEP